MRIRSALLALIALLWSATATASDLNFAVKVVDDEHVPTPAVVLELQSESLPSTVNLVTASNGQTLFGLVPEQVLVNVTAHEASHQRGTALGTVRSVTLPEYVAGTEHSHVFSFSQPVAEEVLVEGAPNDAVTVFPPKAATQNWAFLLPKGSTLRTKLSVGMLWDADAVERFASYYGYTGSLTGVKRAAVVKVPAINFGAEGPALRFFETSGFDYSTHGMKAVVLGSTAQAPSTMTLDVHRIDPAVHGSPEDCVAFTGIVEGGMVLVLWFDNLNPAGGTVQLSYAQDGRGDTPKIPGDSDEPAIQDPPGPQCQTCSPPEPIPPPSWICLITAPSSSLGCAAAVAVGQPESETYISPSGMPFCLDAPGGSRTFTFSETNTFTLSVQIRFQVGGQPQTVTVGGTRSWAESDSVTQLFDSGDHECGECGRGWRIAYIVAQVYTTTHHDWDIGWGLSGPTLTVSLCSETRTQVGSCEDQMGVVTKCSQ